MTSLSLVLLMLMLAPLLSAASDPINKVFSTVRCESSGGRQETETFNLTCTCQDGPAQYGIFGPIDVLRIIGCDGVTTTSPVITLAFMETPPTRLHNFTLPKVRALYLERGRFKLLREPYLALASHPLTRLHVADAELVGGLPQGALAWIMNLRHITFSRTHISAIRDSSVSHLPDLRSLRIVNSSVGSMDRYWLMEVPQLRHLHLIGNEIKFVGSNACNVKPSENQDLDDGAGRAVIERNKIHSMSQGAFRLRGFQHVVFSNNRIDEMNGDSLVVSVRPGGGLFQFTGNVLNHMLGRAITISSEETVRSTTSTLLLGGNILPQGVLSPRQLRITGEFKSSRTFAHTHPNQFRCSCCRCNDTQQLFQLARGVAGDPSRSPTDVDVVFADSILSASCAGDSSASFREFAETCEPGLMRKLAALQEPTPSDITQRRYATESSFGTMWNVAGGETDLDAAQQPLPTDVSDKSGVSDANDASDMDQMNDVKDVSDVKHVSDVSDSAVSTGSSAMMMLISLTAAIYFI